MCQIHGKTVQLKPEIAISNLNWFAGVGWVSNCNTPGTECQDQTVSRLELVQTIISYHVCANSSLKSGKPVIHVHCYNLFFDINSCLFRGCAKNRLSTACFFFQTMFIAEDFEKIWPDPTRCLVY